MSKCMNVLYHGAILVANGRQVNKETGRPVTCVPAYLFPYVLPNFALNTLDDIMRMEENE